MIRRLATLLALLWFGSVESAHAQRSYPSLSRRPVESRDRDAEVAKAAAAEPVTARPLDPAVVSELAKLSSTANAGASAFDKGLADSDRAVGAAKGAAIASESWVVAQEALSVLDASRFGSVTALAGIDTIYINQLDMGGDASAVDAYRMPVLAIVDGQNDRLDSLRDRLARP